MNREKEVIALFSVKFNANEESVQFLDEFDVPICYTEWMQLRKVELERDWGTEFSAEQIESMVITKLKQAIKKERIVTVPSCE